MLYLIDGYNVTRSDPATASSGLEEQREALARRLASRHSELLGAGRIVLVFDGSDAGGVSSSRRGPVEIRFSRGESADDVIVRLAAAEPGPITLVTSDRSLADRVREIAGGGTHVWPRERLYQDARPKRRARRGKSGYPGRAAGLPPGANRITQELKELWLLDDEE